MQKLIIKKGREKPILAHHHWIFSGAIKKMPQVEPGELVVVESEAQERLGIAYMNPKGSLAARMIAFGEQSYEKALSIAIEDACALRKNLFSDSKTDSFRVINGEGDRIPGLIVDRYKDHLVIQVGTQGIEKLKPFLIEELKKRIPSIRCIYEKSEMSTRSQEGLSSIEKVIDGELNKELIIKENGHLFKVDIVEGQKTGFFLDQRNMRELVGQLSYQKKVLNCFSYSGGFSVYALKGQAKSVRSVDISKKAIDLAHGNILLNHLDASLHEGIASDVFSFLKEDALDEDLVILDPPAFAKKKEDVIQACRGYKEINRLAMKKMKKGSLLLTASCSYHVDETLFQQVLFQAALDANRNIKILTKHHQAFDHPVNLFHKEGDYLKSFLLQID